jgi:NAD(P)H-dependent FMN reductase
MDTTAKLGRVFQIAGIAGSLREGSFNRGLLRAAVALSPPTLRITIHDRSIL